VHQVLDVFPKEKYVRQQAHNKQTKFLLKPIDILIEVSISNRETIDIGCCSSICWRL